MDKLHFVASFLLKNESMDGDQFAAAMKAEEPTLEMIEAIAEEKKKTSDEENKTAHENNAKAEAEAKAREEELARRMHEEQAQKRRSPDDAVIDDFLNNFFREAPKKDTKAQTKDEADRSDADTDDTDDKE